MNFKVLISFIYVLTSSLIYMPAPVYANPGQEGTMCKQAAEKSRDACQAAIEGARTAGQAINLGGQQAAQGAGQENLGTISRQATQAQSHNAGETMNACMEAQSQCKQTCDNMLNQFNSSKNTSPPYVISKNPFQQNQSLIQNQSQEFEKGNETCAKEISEMLASVGGEKAGLDQAATESEMTRQAAENQSGAAGGGSGGGMSPMMAGLLGAALGAGAAMLMNKKKKDKEKDKKNPVSEDGTVDCTVDGSQAYSDCNEHYVEKCIGDLNAEACKSFTNRYCSASGNSNNDSNTTPATSDSGIIIASAEDKDIKGEGVGTQYCFTAQATNFCATSGRETCPSCLQLETNKADVCKANPALCLAQNSPAEIEAAKNSCPSDPMFSNPNYTAGGGSTIGDNTGAPDPVLPGQYASSSTSESIIGNSGTGNSSSGFGSGSNGSDTTTSNNNPNRGVGFSGSDSELSDPVLPSGVQIASAKKTLPSRNPTSVGGAMGPSLFSMSSAIIESRCRKGELAHCAPR